VIELTTIYCPECGAAAEDMTPENEPGFRDTPGYRHVGDRTALCPVLTRGAWQPAEPVEDDRDEADV
jgi:hypothetical protein